MLLVIPSIRKLFTQVSVQDCLVYKDMKPLALIYKALTRIIMTSGVTAFQGILKTEIMRSLARVSEGLQQYELSHHPMKNLLYKALALSQWINL